MYGIQKRAHVRRRYFMNIRWRNVYTFDLYYCVEFSVGEKNRLGKMGEVLRKLINLNLRDSSKMFSCYT